MILYGVVFSHTPSNEVYTHAGGEGILELHAWGVVVLWPGKAVLIEFDGVGGLFVDDAVCWFLIGKAWKRGLVGVAGGVMVESP